MKLKQGDKLVRRLGRHPGPEREVVKARRNVLGDRFVRLRWQQMVNRRLEPFEVELYIQPDTGLPAGYVLAKDRKAKKAGAK